MLIGNICKSKMLNHIFILFFAFTFCFDNVATSRGRELEKKLFKNYSSTVRPAMKKADKTAVFMTIFIQHIQHIDDRKQNMKIHGALHTFWQDHRLQWAPNEYNYTDSIYVRSYQVWTPEVRVLNSVDGNKEQFQKFRDDALLFYTGYVSFTQDFTFTVSCQLSHNRYPHDRQHCPVVLASLMYDYSQLDWTYGWAEESAPTVEQRLDWRTAKRHLSGWQLINITAKKAYLTPAGIQDAAPTLTSAWRWAWPLVIADVELVRHKPYFYLLEATPMLLTAILTLTSFWIDAPLLTLAIQLSAIIAQGFFSWDLFAELPPATDGMPRMATAYAFNFGMTSVAFLLHIVIQYLSHQEAASGFVPPFVSAFVDTVHQTPLFRSAGIRLYPSPASHSDLTRLSVDIDDQGRSEIKTVAKNVGSLQRIQKIALVARRIFFWAYVLIYSIFIIVIAV